MGTPVEMIENIETIALDNPVDKIIARIKSLISSGHLKPGDRLPPERELTERFGVSRGIIREALLKLQFYGLLKTSPQSGTYVAGLSMKILDTIFFDIINFNKDDFASLIEARYHLEISSARLAAEKRDEEDIARMRDALEDMEEKMKQGLPVVQEDMLFHIKMAAATKNSVMESMMIILVPDLIKVIVANNVCNGKRCTDSVTEHWAILHAIIRKDPDAAAAAMAEHLRLIMEARLTLK